MERNDGFALALLNWFALNGRDLPWRQTNDPYAIWLSEVILQQTRVAQGTAYWHRFMERYPDVEHLAAASEDDVLRLWQGLGYYSRARNLHTAARQIVALGAFPQTFDAIKQLKGVGDYTAAAVASIAFNEPVAVVDGNVYRVLARYFGIDTPINTTEGKKTFTRLANLLLPPAQASLFNQALMDFGAIQCTPASPRCLLCPLSETCVALRAGTIETLPVKLRKITVKTRTFEYIYVRWNGKTALRRRGKGDIWQGLWEPSVPQAFAIETPQTIERLAQAYPQLRRLATNVKHVLTHQILFTDFYLLELQEKPRLSPDYQWIDEQQIDDYALPRLIEKLFEEYLPDNPL